MIFTLSLVCIVISYYMYFWVKERDKIKKDPRQPLRHPGEWPFVGHAHKAIGNTAHIWKALKEAENYSIKNGGVSTFLLGTKKIHLLTDPEDCIKVGSTCLLNDPDIYNVVKPWVADGLLMAPLTIWRKLRKMLLPAFSQKVLDTFMSEFNKQSRKLVQTLSAEVGTDSFDHAPIMERNSLEIICLTMMGLDDDSDIKEKDSYMEAIATIYNIFIQRAASVWMMNDFLFKYSSLKRKQDEVLKIIHTVSSKVIKIRKSDLQIKNNSGENDLENTKIRFKPVLDLLLESSMNGSMTDSEVKSEVDTLIAAGSETSGILLTFLLVLIGSYPQIQQKILKEIQDILDGSDRDIEKEDFQRMVYLEAVVKECVRFCPVVPFISRVLDQDMVLKNYNIPAGESCLLSIYAMHYNPIWGEDRMTFNPDRWLNGEPPGTFAGFGFGKRSCIGYKYAMMSAKTALAHLLRNYIVFADHTKMELKLDVLLKSNSGHFIRLEKRN